MNNQCNNKDKEYNALVLLFTRYRKLVVDNKDLLDDNCCFDIPEECTSVHLLKLLDEAINNYLDYPTDKLHRWLGFTQGILTLRNIINVKDERNFTRPLLHSYHTEKPPTFG